MHEGYCVAKQNEYINNSRSSRRINYWRLQLQTSLQLYIMQIYRGFKATTKICAVNFYNIPYSREPVLINKGGAPNNKAHLKSDELSIVS